MCSYRANVCLLFRNNNTLMLLNCVSVDISVSAPTNDMQSMQLLALDPEDTNQPETFKVSVTLYN